MPTYEYKCSECSHVFEIFQVITDEPVKVCPKCGGEVNRLIGAGAGLLFKGKGFYITDYRSESYKKGASADKSNSSTSSSNSTQKKDGK
jgi:putative FmdB family regulatory protein